jgi:hypothetical protein
MSRTKKDLPYWVMLLNYGEIKHDHSYGICVIKEPHQSSYRYPWEHIENCPKISYIEESCRGDCYLNFYLKFIRKYRDEEERKCNDIHRYRKIDNNINCKVCDEEKGNCEYRIKRSSDINKPIYGNPPKWWRKHKRHKPARVDKKKILGVAKKEYNSLHVLDKLEMEEIEWEPAKKRREGYWD